MNPIRINATGCALMDYIYPNLSFNSPVFKKYLTVSEGDGGLSPGKLVFAEEIEKFSGQDINDIINELTGSAAPISSNIGGPAIVSMINAAQLLGKDAEIKFFGALGDDPIGKEFLRLLAKTPVDDTNFKIVNGLTAFTDVLIDPTYENGFGERCFINNIGAAGNFEPDLIPEHFFDAEIVVFSGTALVPQIHDHLDQLLLMARKKNCFTIVSTVYDFRNEKDHPGRSWPLAEGKNIDLLIMDHEEALRISGTMTIDAACEFFISSGLNRFIITNGPCEVLMFSTTVPSAGSKIQYFEVSKKVLDLIGSGIYKGDTTGCGDNFCGGVIYSIATQLKENPGPNPDLKEAIIWGIASGGFACSYKGGCYFEKKTGGKKEALEEIVNAYRIQCGY